MTTESGDVLIYRYLLEAWNRRDAAAFAAVFAEHGHAIGFDGTAMQGRSQIQHDLQGVFANHQTATYVAKVRDIRALAPGVTLIRAVVGMVPPGQRDVKPDVNALQSIVVVEGATGGHIALLQNTPAAFHGRPELADQLTAELNQVAASGDLLTIELGSS